MIKVASLFSQILSTIRTAVNFDNLVARHEAEKNSKRYFTTRCSIYGLLHKKAHLSRRRASEYVPRPVTGGVDSNRRRVFRSISSDGFMVYYDSTLS